MAKSTTPAPPTSAQTRSDVPMPAGAPPVMRGDGRGDGQEEMRELLRVFTAMREGDFTVRLWDTAPLKKRSQARREVEAARPEADRLVQRLFGELREPDPVVARLRDDGSLSPPLRRAALQEVLRQRGPR